MLPRRVLWDEAVTASSPGLVCVPDSAVAEGLGQRSWPHPQPPAHRAPYRSWRPDALAGAAPSRALRGVGAFRWQLGHLPAARGSRGVTVASEETPPGGVQRLTTPAAPRAGCPAGDAAQQFPADPTPRGLAVRAATRSTATSRYRRGAATRGHRHAARAVSLGGRGCLAGHGGDAAGGRMEPAALPPPLAICGVGRGNACAWRVEPVWASVFVWVQPPQGTALRP